MKTFGIIFRIIAGVLLGVYLLILLLLNFSPANRWLTQTIEAALEKKLATELNIGQVEVSLFDRVILHDVLLKDQQGREMLTAEMISVKIDISSLVEEKIEFRTISILDSDIKLYKENKTSKPNYQFIVDAFSKKDKKEPAKLDLKINSFILRRGSLSFDQLDQPQTPGLINLSHIKVDDLDASISLRHLTQDSLNMRVRSLSLHEQSGLDLEELRLNVALGKNNVRLENLSLQLPNSSVELNDCIAYYKGKTIADKVNSLSWNGSIKDIELYTEDLACFYSPLKGLKQKLFIAADCSLAPNKFEFRDIRLNNAEKNVQLISDLQLETQNKTLQKVVAEISNVKIDKQGITLIKEVLHRIKPNADLEKLPFWTTIDELTANGVLDYEKDKENFAQLDLETNLGSAEANVHWKDLDFKGDVSTTNLDMAKLFSKEQMPKGISAYVSGQFDINNRKNPQIDALANIEQIEYNNHLFKDISVAGTLNDHHCVADFTSRNDVLNLDGTIQCLVEGKEVSDIVSTLSIQSLKPSVFNFTKFGENIICSGDLNFNVSSLSFPKASANVEVVDFNISGEKNFHISSLYAKTSPSSKGRYLSLNSDIADLEFDGPVTSQSLHRLKDNVLHYLVPEKVEQTALSAHEEWVVRANIKDTKILKSVFDIPLNFADDTSLEARIGGINNAAFVSFYTDSVAYGKMTIDNPRLYFRGEDGIYKALVQCGKKIKNTNVKFELNAQTTQDKLVTEVLWDDASAHKYYGSLGLISTKSQDGAFVTEFQPTELMINDSLWLIVPGSVAFKDKRFSVADLGIARQGQSLNLNGHVSKDKGDKLVADVERIDVNYILELFNVKPVKISGNATGRLTLAHAFDSLKVEAKGLDVPNFAFNDAYIGHGKVDGSFTMKDKRLWLHGDIQEKGIGYTLIDGYVGIGEKSIDLKIRNKNTNLAFLNKYISTIFGDLQGRATGHCRVHGKFTSIDFEGDEDGEATAKILITNVPYTVKDGKVKMSAGCFDFSGFKVYDGLGGEGVLSGYLKHNHLKDLSYDIQVQAKDMLFYDRSRELDMPFYATAGGTGKVHIYGRPGELIVDAQARPHDKTQLYFMLDNPNGEGDVEFLRFRDAEALGKSNENSPLIEDATINDIQAVDRDMDIKLNFTIDLNPEAKLFIVTDEKAGDRIQMGGTGTVTATYYNKGEFEMLGNVVVQNGNYKLSLQDVIRKEFILEPGGTIQFIGDPLQSQLNIRAKYVVPSVSLSDLNIGTKLSDSSVPVNCVLLVGGTAGHPQISFDLDLPRVSDDIKRMVRGLIHTEEDMNMQVLYLLGVGRFYTYNYASTAAAETQTQSSVAVKSFLSNTLTGQLNNIISNAMGTTNWTFGTNLSTGSLGWSDIEVEGLLSGRLLNNRLLINGNFGYRDRPLYGNSNFVGDFDVQYILTPSGGVSVKVYSETNDRYFSKSSLTTQGAGLQLKRQFTDFRDLFTIRRKKQIKVFEKESEEVANDSISSE
jgi:hypothetical protein